MVDVEFDDLVVHFVRLGVANSFSGESFEVGSEVAVFSFDVGGVRFSNLMFLGRDNLCIGFEIVGRKSLDLYCLEFFEQSFAGALVSFTDVKSQDFLLLRDVGVPNPTFLLFSFAHKRPKLVHLGVLENTAKLGFWYF